MSEQNMTYYSPEELSRIVGTRWQHVKRGTTYEVLTLCRIEAGDTSAVAYKCEQTGVVWVRPHREFLDGRFKLLGSPVPERAILDPQNQEKK